MSMLLVDTPAPYDAAGDDRCLECGGRYGAPDLVADPYDYPCTCPFPPDQLINPTLGEQFTQEDGKPGWYSADGLHVLRTTPIRAAFNGPGGEPLYVYPNLSVRPPRGAAPPAELTAELAGIRAQLAAERAEVTRLRAELVRQDDQLARLANRDAQAALLQLEHEAEVERARRAELVRILESPDLTPAGRVTVALAADAAAAYKLRLIVGCEAERSEPVAVNIADLEQRAGIGEGTACRHLAPAAEVGLISRVIQTQPTDSDDDLAFRTTVLIGPGSGVSEPRRRDPRRLKENARKQAVRERKAAEEAALRARVAELEAAAAQAAQHGCPICGGALLPTGYFCPRCDCERSVSELARLTRGSHECRANYFIYRAEDSAEFGQTIGNIAQDGQRHPRAPDPPEGGRSTPPGHRYHPD